MGGKSSKSEPPTCKAEECAFYPPRPPSYSISTDPDSGDLQLRGIRNLRDDVEAVVFETADKRKKERRKIAGLFLRRHGARLTLLFSHGNAADVGQMYTEFVRLSDELDVNVLGYDYSGYGASTGKPTEKNIYGDIDAALQCLKTKFKIPEEDVVIYGQSIGSGPTVDLASRNPRVRGVVLHSPFMSWARVVEELKRPVTDGSDIFRNIDKISLVKRPVLVLHGTQDRVVDVSHGQALAKAAKDAYEPLYITGGGHNDLTHFHATKFYNHLKDFITYLEQHPPPPAGK